MVLNSCYLIPIKVAQYSDPSDPIPALLGDESWVFQFAQTRDIHLSAPFPAFQVKPEAPKALEDTVGNIQFFFNCTVIQIKSTQVSNTSDEVQ